MAIDYNKYPFDVRIRHHVSSNLYFPLNKQSIKITETYPPLVENVNWAEYFRDSKAPEILDIGCGMGKFLLDYSLELKNQNILGIEVRIHPVNWINEVIKGEKLSNVHALWYSVVNRIDFIETESIEMIFYFFPDPWFKEKHKKRRAFKLEFIEDCYRVLKKGGTLYLQTDIEDVYNHQLKLLNKFNSDNQKFRIYTPDSWDFPKTDQEIHCIKKSFPYWRLCVEKI